MKAIVKAKAEPGLTLRIRERDVQVSVRLGSRDGGFPCLKSINSKVRPVLSAFAS